MTTAEHVKGLQVAIDTPGSLVIVFDTQQAVQESGRLWQALGEATGKMVDVVAIPFQLGSTGSAGTLFYVHVPLTAETRRLCMVAFPQYVEAGPSNEKAKTLVVVMFADTQRSAEALHKIINKTGIRYGRAGGQVPPASPN